MKAHKVPNLWRLLNLSSIPNEKNMHGNKNVNFFSTIHSCPASQGIFNKGMQVESKCQIACVLYSLKFSNTLLYNTSLMTYFNWKGRKANKFP